MSFQQGLSGLNASSRSLEVIGNNIANANTIGAKSSRAEFSTIYSNSLGGSGDTDVGIGVNLAAVTQNFSQGGIETTGNPLDIAINGEGFFQMQKDNNPVAYTRNGEFHTDKDGYIVNASGYKLIGVPAGGGVPKELQVATSGIDPVATKKTAMEINFDSRGGTTGSPIDPTAPDYSTVTMSTTDAKTYNNATSTTVYDVKGQPVTVSYYFQKVSTDTWNVYATANGKSLFDPAELTTSLRPLATINFPATGSNPIKGDATAVPPAAGTVTSYAWDLVSAGAPATATTVDTGLITLPQVPGVTLATGGTSEPIPLGTVDPATNPAITLDLSASTQFGSGFVVTQMTTDGNARGELLGVTVQSDGTITSKYSNGQTQSSGQIQLASFRNKQGLQPIGANMWASTPSSGTASVNDPGNGLAGALKSGALEQSNIDLTAELVNMMTAQRAYQANAQTIKTEDQVMSTLVNMR